MPREHKQRGRRAEEKKRKLDDTTNGDDHENHDSPKRQRTTNGDHAAEPFVDQDDYQPVENGFAENGAFENRAFEDEAHDSHQMGEKPFFGMLDEEEQEYFRKADEMLELNLFADPEERNLFLANVYREADGKELKIANSQSCSRLMERLIKMSSPQQLKTLFQKFNGNFVHLIQHRFASHCCEKLFTQAAPIVTEELLHPPNPEAASISNGGVYVSMENLFLYTIAELEGSIGFLMTDRFASHALRVLLLVLAGEPMTGSSTKSLLQSKRKENVTVNGDNAHIGANGAEAEEEKLKAVPKAFTEALEKLMTDSIAGLDTNSLRALATHQLGNPTLQLLLKLELTHFGKQRAKDERSIIRTLLPDDPIVAESDSAAFIKSLVYDTIGSHLMETIIEFSPGKMFKNLYKEFFKERIASLARNEIAGYVACKVLERLSRDDLMEAHMFIAPQIPALVERNRIAVIKTLIQRCEARKVDTQAIAIQLDDAYKGEDGGFDIVKMLKVVDLPLPNGDALHNSHERSHADPAKVQGSVLAQAMILVPGPLSSLIFDSISRMSPALLVAMARDPVTTRTLQAAMTSTNASIISRRKLVQQFYGTVGDMALDRSASRVVDAIWEGTHGLAFIRERIAEELAENEPALRDSPCGRAVWKNWKMDLYKRRRQEWVVQSKVKASDDGFQSFAEVDKNKQKMENPEGKSRLQLARERHAANKAKKERR